MSTSNNSQPNNFPFSNLFSNNFLPYSSDTPQKETFRPSLVNSSQYEENLNLKYYEEYKKLYFTAYCISLQFGKLDKTHQDLLNRIHKVQTNLSEDIKNEISSHNLDKEKRQRRKADDIQRKFCCLAQRCGRSYGSEGSLQQHIKLKHPNQFKENIAVRDDESL